MEHRQKNKGHYSRICYYWLGVALIKLMKSRQRGESNEDNPMRTTSTVHDKEVISSMLQIPRRKREGSRAGDTEVSPRAKPFSAFPSFPCSEGVMLLIFPQRIYMHHFLSTSLNVSSITCILSLCDREWRMLGWTVELFGVKWGWVTQLWLPRGKHTWAAGLMKPHRLLASLTL